MLKFMPTESPLTTLPPKIVLLVPLVKHGEPETVRVALSGKKAWPVPSLKAPEP